MSNDKVDWSIVDNALENAEMRLGLAKVDINQGHASIRQPVGGAGDQSHSYNAALLVAKAKFAGVEAEVAALKALHPAHKQEGHSPLAKPAAAAPPPKPVSAPPSAGLKPTPAPAPHAPTPEKFVAE